MSAGLNSTGPWPTALRYSRGERCLHVSFDSGDQFDLPAELLRVESPSAEVKGHGPGQKKTVPGKQRVGISRIEPVGRYAVRLIFDDGHDSGLFSWSYLHELGTGHQTIWQAYLNALKAQGLSR